MRANTTEDRAVLVSGRGVYDVSDCEDMVKKGEIAWPSQNAQLGLYFAALSSHEIAISHDAKRVYSGLGFAVADIEDLDSPDSWTVRNWSCEMNKQSNFPGSVPSSCDGPTQQDAGRQYSHSSDDNLEGTVWYGANQEGSGSQMEPATARMVDISNPDSIEILDTLPEFPGHSMNWWRTWDGRDFIIGANEGLGAADSCVPYPRPKNLGNALDAYVVEVTGNKFGEPFPLTLDINKPENWTMWCSTFASRGTVDAADVVLRGLLAGAVRRLRFRSQSTAVPHALSARYTIPRFRDISRMTVRLRMRAVGLDVLQDLVDSGDLLPEVLAAMPTFTLHGAAVEWTPGASALRSLSPSDLNCGQR